MDAAQTQILPSAPARQMFGRMVARAQGSVLGLDQTIALGVQRRRAGEDPAASPELEELVHEMWIRPDPDGGGWIIIDGGC